RDRLVGQVVERSAAEQLQHRLQFGGARAAVAAFEVGGAVRVGHGGEGGGGPGGGGRGVRPARARAGAGGGAGGGGAHPRPGAGGLGRARGGARGQDPERGGEGRGAAGDPPAGVALRQVPFAGGDRGVLAAAVRARAADPRADAGGVALAAGGAHRQHRRRGVA